MTLLLLQLVSCSRPGESVVYQRADVSVGQELNEAYCSRVPWIMVGRVVELDSHKEESMGGMVATSVSVRTVSIAKGSVPRRFDFDIAGGEMDGVVSRVNGMPKPTIDSVYLWMLTHFEDSKSGEERVVLMDCYALDASAEMPDSAALAVMWREQCSDRGSSMGLSELKFLPGVPFLPATEGGVFGECSHQ